MIVLIGNRNWVQKLPTILAAADAQDIIVLPTEEMLELAQSAAKRMYVGEIVWPKLMTEETFKTMEAGEWVYSGN